MRNSSTVLALVLTFPPITVVSVTHNLSVLLLFCDSYDAASVVQNNRLIIPRGRATLGFSPWWTKMRRRMEKP